VALLELVDNAIEHTPGDSRVTVEFTDGPDDAVRIAVHDDGPGIPREEWDIVTGDREITQLQHASGLGLWLVKWVADTHGGTLSLERTGADGSTVAIDLPR
jgi:signal transduction histidine kinase